MPLHSIQVTIPTGGGPVQVNVASKENRLIRYIVFQNNAAGTMRIGDSTVSSTKGFLLAATGGTLAIGPNDIYFQYIDDWWVVGTATQILDITFCT